MSIYLEPKIYLPHEPPMVLIDTVKSVIEEECACASYVKDTGVLAPFLDENGNLETFYTLELFAQTVGVWSGFWAREKNLNIPPMGMILGARDIKCDITTFSKNSELSIEVKKILDDETLALFEGKIIVDNNVLATGRVNVIRVTNEDLKKLFVR